MSAEPCEIKDFKEDADYLSKPGKDFLSAKNGACELVVEGLSVSYGVVQAVKEVSFSLRRGEILALIGSNGAGKTTILKAISRLVPCSSGKIKYGDHDLREMKSHQIVKLGLAHVPEGRGIFLNLTVEENLDLGAWANPSRKETKKDLDHVYALLERLFERRRQSAGTLSGGELQMLAIGRAIMARPQVLLLDEPSLGLAPQLIERIFELIVSLNKEGRSVLLVEQNARMALGIASRGIVLESGSIVLSGQAGDLLNSDEVRKAYLGEID